MTMLAYTAPKFSKRMNLGSFCHQNNKMTWQKKIEETKTDVRSPRILIGRPSETTDKLLSQIP